MDLSVIIVSWNTKKILRDCLASLAAATEGLTVEVFVVDNGSADGSAEMVRSQFPHYRLSESGGNLGFSRANNLALKEVTGRAILLLNPDTVCPPGSLTRLCEFMQRTVDAGIAGPTLVDEAFRPVHTYGNFPAIKYHWLNCLDPQRTWLPHSLRTASFGCIPTMDASTQPVAYVTGACLLIRREAFEKVGLLDERFFMYFEETDWCLRVWRAGFKVYHCAEVQVVHLEGKSAEKVNLFRLAQFQASYRLFVVKHYGPGRVWMYRLAQFAEYYWKGILRWLAPGDHNKNRSLARHHFTIAKLQLKNNLKPQPPI